MKTIEINISRDEIDTEISKMTAYTGFKSPSAGNQEEYDRIATVDEDTALLDRYWATAGNTLAERLKGFVTVFGLTAGALTLTLEVSGSYDDTMTPSVRGDLRDYMAAAMLRSWFSLTLPAKAEEWEVESGRLLRDISSKLHHRQRPKRQVV